MLCDLGDAPRGAQQPGGAVAQASVGESVEWVWVVEAVEQCALGLTNGLLRQ